MRGRAAHQRHAKSEGHRPVLLEVCVETVSDAVAAAAGGADRIELNAALALDGLTPSLGLLVEIRRAVGKRLPVIAMARPRPGDFCYDAGDFRVLLRDARLLPEHGADGVAFGVLTGRGDVDVARCRKVIRAIESAAGAGTDVVFHRAFDRVRDPRRALEQLIDLGVRRVMTSGQQPTALLGMVFVQELVERAAGRIELLPAGGVRPDNARDLIAGTGCTQLHTSLREPGATRMSPRLLRRTVRTLAGAGRP